MTLIEVGIAKPQHHRHRLWHQTGPERPQPSGLGPLRALHEPRWRDYPFRAHSEEDPCQGTGRERSDSCQADLMAPAERRGLDSRVLCQRPDGGPADHAAGGLSGHRHWPGNTAGYHPLVFDRYRPLARSWTWCVSSCRSAPTLPGWLAEQAERRAHGGRQLWAVVPPVRHCSYAGVYRRRRGDEGPRRP